MQRRSFGGRPSGRSVSGLAYRGRPRPNQRRNTKQRIHPSRFISKAVEQTEELQDIKNQFIDFGLDPRLLANIAHLGFDMPLPIQDQAIPHALQGLDVIGLANTGTGKTAAFLIPLLDKHVKGEQKQQTLIMAPTRELAIQIEDDFRKLAFKLNLFSALCVGGKPIWKQQKDLARNPDFIIGTPGRLKDLLDRGSLKLQYCHSLVLDEVDRMVDMGFIQDITYILGKLPAERQSLFFTATISAGVETIMRTFLREPIKISVITGETSQNVEQDVIKVGHGQDKIEKLCEILSRSEVGKALVFGETKRGVEKIHRALTERGVQSASIHGDKSQSQRQRALNQFRSNEVAVLIATDVAARGLDVKDITHVINFDTPQTYDDYVHRIGRAGRAGKKGYALTFVEEHSW